MACPEIMAIANADTAMLAAFRMKLFPVYLT
jgi:hypothetical protein